MADPFTIAPASSTPARPPERALAPFGSRVQLGRVRDGEAHSALRTPRARAQEFAKVLRTDAVASMAWRHYLSLMLEPEFVAEAPRGSGGDAAAAARLVNEGLGLAGCAGTWGDSRPCDMEGLVRHLAHADWYGWALAEPVWRLDSGEYVPDGYVAVEHETLDEWACDAEGRVAGAVLRGVSPDGRYHTVRLDRWRWIHHTLGGGDQSPEGSGLARPIYSLHIDLTDAYNASAAAMQRWSAPTPLVQWDRQAGIEAGYSESEIDGADNTSSHAARAEEQAGNYMASGSGYLSAPKHVTFEAFGSGVDPAQGVSAITHLESRIALAFFATGLLLGIDSSGARSVGEVIERAAEQQVKNRLQAMAGALQRGLVAPMVGWNFPNLSRREYPRLVPHGVRTGSLGRLSNVLAQLVQADLLTPDEDVRAWVAREAGMWTQGGGER